MQVLRVQSLVQTSNLSIRKFSLCGGLPARSLPSFGSASWSWKSRFPSVSIGSPSQCAGLATQKLRESAQLRCMATDAPVEVLVKAAVGHPDQLGDCPFSQRVLLTLEEKHIPYEAKYIDSSNKPAWFLEANPEGKVPVIKDDGKWVADSDVITVILEDKFPDPSLAAPAVPVGSKLFGVFVKFLTSKDPADGSEQPLLDELNSLDIHLKENGPFLNGEKISSLDLALSPKLYHLTIALKHYKKWSIPPNFVSLNSYIEATFSRESFVKTKAPEEVVVNGWKAKVTGA